MHACISCFLLEEVVWCLSVAARWNATGCSEIRIVLEENTVLERGEQRTKAGAQYSKRMEAAKGKETPGYFVREYGGFTAQVTCSVRLQSVFQGEEDRCRLDLLLEPFINDRSAQRAASAEHVMTYLSPPTDGGKANTMSQAPHDRVGCSEVCVALVVVSHVLLLLLLLLLLL